MAFKHLATLLATAAAFLGANAAPKNYDNGIGPHPANGHWVDTWTAMPQLTEYTNLPLPPFVGTLLLLVCSR